MTDRCETVEQLAAILGARPAPEATVSTDRVRCRLCGWDDGGALVETETLPADAQALITYETEGQRVDFCGGCEAPLGPETIGVFA